MRWSTRTLLFIYRLSYFHLILYLWKLQRTPQRRPSCWVWWPLSRQWHLSGGSFLIVSNEQVMWSRTKSQPQDTKHKGLKLLTFVTCQFLMARIFRYFEMMKNSSHLFFKRLFGTSRHPAGVLACSVNWNIFILYQIYFKMCLGYINRNQYKYGSYNESQKCAQLYY